MQKRLDININDYKDYSEKYSSIELEIIPMKYKYSRFINIKKEEQEYYHIYFNDNKENEIKSTSIDENLNVSKINIIIDYQIKNLLKNYFVIVNILNLLILKILQK